MAVPKKGEAPPWLRNAAKAKLAEMQKDDAHGKKPHKGKKKPKKKSVPSKNPFAHYSKK